MSLEATVPMPAIQPSPIFPTGSGPLTPMRIFPLDDDASGSAPPPPPSNAQPAGEPEAQDVPDTRDMQEETPAETPAETPDEAVTTSTADQASPDQPPEAAQRETPEMSGVTRMEQVEKPAP
jgi:hypothetical protein